MPDIPDAAGLARLALGEFQSAAAAVAAGDDNATELVENVGRLVSAVGNTSLKSLTRAGQLHADDLMNIAGKERLLAALPSELIATTTESLEQADILLDVLEGAHVAAILRHDGRQDHNLIAELQNWTANLKPSEAAATLAGLAADVRYSTFLSGPFGDSLRARFNIKDPEFFRRIAFETLALNGTPEQQRRSVALRELPQLRRVVGLARGARDAAVDEVKRRPAPKPSGALL
jgi:hypothetical protein